jgi:hypothetical protein
MWWLCYEREGRTVAVVIVEASSLVHAQMHAAIASLGGGGRFTVGHRLDTHCVAQLAPEDFRRNLSPTEADALLERFTRRRPSEKRKPPAPSIRRRAVRERRQA